MSLDFENTSGLSPTSRYLNGAMRTKEPTTIGYPVLIASRVAEVKVFAGRPKNLSIAPPEVCWSMRIVIAAFVSFHWRMISGLNPFFLSITVTGPRKWCFAIHFAASLLFMTRAIAIIGRANERTFVAASQTPWWELTSMIGVSSVSRRSFTASGWAPVKSRCSRQFSFVTTPGTKSASPMCPARWQNDFFAIRRASFSSDVIPHFRTFSTAILRRFGINSHTQAARPAPTSYACLWTKFIICIIPNYAVRQRDTKSLFALA